MKNLNSCVIIKKILLFGDIMSIFDGLLLCTDLDGTLLNNDGIVSKENLDAIEYFKAEGGRFTFVTGRPPVIAKDIYEIIRCNAPIGCYNGGGVYDFSSEKYLWMTTLPKSFIELVAFADEKMPDIGIQLNTEKQIYFNKDNPAMEVFRKMTGLPNIGCHYTDVSESVIKVVFGHLDGDRVSELAKLLSTHPRASEFDFIRSEHMLYEILPKGVSKGNLLIKLAELLNIDIAKTVAVGDYNNDISMIKAAGIGYAVENAVPEAKAVADRVTVSNGQHAIAKLIEELEYTLGANENLYD